MTTLLSKRLHAYVHVDAREHTLRGDMILCANYYYQIVLAIRWYLSDVVLDVATLSPTWQQLA